MSKEKQGVERRVTGNDVGVVSRDQVMDLADHGQDLMAIFLGPWEEPLPEGTDMITSPSELHFQKALLTLVMRL